MGKLYDYEQFTLAVDLDGVVFDFDKAWVERYWMDFPAEAAERKLEPNMPQQWDDLYERTHFGSMWFFWEWWNETGGFTNVPMYEDAHDALWAINEYHTRIVYITGRPWEPERFTQTTYRELIKASVPMYGLIHSEAKQFERYHVLVEDNPNTIRTVAYHRGMRSVIRVQRPWNEIDDDAGSLEHRVAVLGVAKVDNLADLSSRWVELIEERT